jgi:uncharacterized protein (UPF0548 family)
MATWRFGIGWTEAELQEHLAGLAGLSPNFDAPFERMTRENGWTVDGAEEAIGSEPAGPPQAGGLFARARRALIHYDFSDPRIVEGHFDPEAPFRGRDMLLEIKVLGLRYLNGVRVTEVRDETAGDQTLFGFRYDTLEGHIERGGEWFLLTKAHATGEIRFRIEAHWQLGEFPNWWSRLGFRLFGEHFRTLWRHRAPERLRRLGHQPVEKPLAEPGELAHQGEVTPKRTK